MSSGLQHNQEGRRVIVVGCGVEGLSSGIRLLEAGYQVSIWARDVPPHTTSNIAAAIWHPYKVAPDQHTLAWGARSYEVFQQLAQTEGAEAGIKFKECLELFREPTPDPWWRDAVGSFRRSRPGELPPGYEDAYVFETPVIETSIYMPYLVERFERLGGNISRREIHSLARPLAESDIVVNCAGLGARSLVGDEALYPVRGQVVRISVIPEERVWLDEQEGGDGYDLTYIVPRSADCILGGTAQPGNRSLEPDMQTAREIIERCARLVPQAREAQILEHLVGLRPGRDIVRLEAQPQPEGKLVIHNYGHSGGGVTLSWGCAEEVVSLLDGLP